MKISGVAIGALSAGVLLAWSGIKGWSVLGTLQDVVSGKQPAGTTGAGTPISGATAPLSSSGTAAAGTGSGSIVSDAEKYKGHAYLYGGAPGAAGTSPWDCSSFCNWVLSHDLGLPWPGKGRYDGKSHGPTTVLWAAWFRAGSGGTSVVPRSQVQAGDIIVWAAHMGIAISNSQMISAENPKSGTGISNIDGGGSGPLLVCGRMPGS